MLTLKTPVILIKKINKKTKAEFWGEVEVGDLLSISLNLSSPGRGSRGLYATYLKVKNLLKGKISSESLTMTPKYIDNFEYEESKFDPKHLKKLDAKTFGLFSEGIIWLHGMEAYLDFAAKNIAVPVDGGFAYLIDDYQTWAKENVRNRS